MKNDVLIIDDDSYTIDLYNMMMEWSENKAHIKTELSAEKAMNYLKKLQENDSATFPDFILLDLRMPEMHGFDFIREFEKSFPEQKQNTVFIITTSSVIKKERKNAFQFNCVKEYLVKPIPANYLENLITRGI